jgi:pyruvate/2-oxoglutarate dehydrogenase complex dihydrolipoamide acyltransferase (E2) component
MIPRSRLATIASTQRMMPAVARLVAEHQLEGKLKDIQATGPKGQLLKGDILIFLGKIKPRAPPVPTGVQGPPPSATSVNIATIIKERLAHARKEQQYQIVVTADRALDWLKRLKSKCSWMV